MGIPSVGDLRGQRDAVGFATTAAEMAALWELAQAPPPPEKLGDMPTSGVVGIVCPHDDYVYAGRMYRLLVPQIRARHVVVIGVLHGWQRLGIRDRLVFDPFRAWRTPDGEVPISSLQPALLARLSGEDVVISRQASESEHSAEAVVYWLRHQNPHLEIIPILVPGMSFSRLQELAQRLGQALRGLMQEQKLKAGEDLALVISADAVHYGPDFHHTPFGEGGVQAYLQACQRDKDLLLGPLAGEVTREKVWQAFSTWVDPENVGTYRLTWCGRFSIPFGYLLASSAFGPVVAKPVAYATSVGWPELAGPKWGLGRTAPANLYHFVGYPGVVLTLEKPLRFLGPPERQR
jgi:AmmeMemoRadiSam system protein B